MAEALQDLITKNAKNNEIDDVDSNGQDVRGEQDDQGSDTNKVNTEPWKEVKWFICKIQYTSFHLFSFIVLFYVPFSEY